MKVAIVGGTGALGKGLAARLAASQQVAVGSRDEARARSVAAQISARGPRVEGKTSAEAASWCDAAILAVPDLEDPGFLRGLAGGLAGKLVVSPIVPMKMDGGTLVYTLASGSAAERVAAALPKSRVAAALHTVPAPLLAKPEVKLDCDTLVAADSRETYEEASALVGSIPGLRPLYAGHLSGARTLEQLTPLLLNVAKLNGMRNLSVRFV
jgi:8-hydroxy-5-deazaflavin:NADPH oxidoreductase